MKRYRPITSSPSPPLSIGGFLNSQSLLKPQDIQILRPHSATRASHVNSSPSIHLVFKSDNTATTCSLHRCRAALKQFQPICKITNPRCWTPNKGKGPIGCKKHPPTRPGLLLWFVLWMCALVWCLCKQRQEYFTYLSDIGATSWSDLVATLGTTKYQVGNSYTVYRFGERSGIQNKRLSYQPFVRLKRIATQSQVKRVCGWLGTQNIVRMINMKTEAKC